MNALLLSIIVTYIVCSWAFGAYFVSLSSQVKNLDWFIIIKKWKTVFVLMPLIMWLLVILAALFYAFVGIIEYLDNRRLSNAKSK